MTNLVATVETHASGGTQHGSFLKQTQSVKQKALRREELFRMLKHLERQLTPENKGLLQADTTCNRQASGLETLQAGGYHCIDCSSKA